MLLAAAALGLFLAMLYLVRGESTRESGALPNEEVSAAEPGQGRGILLLEVQTADGADYAGELTLTLAGEDGQAVAGPLDLARPPYRIANLEPGSYRLRVEAPNGAEDPEWLDARVRAERTERLRIELR
ncbi:MAG: hypothetical protein AAF682_02635 [Planctomycetota bacterium]